MKIFRLTYNEIVKLIKKTSFKVCMILFFVFIVLLSILFYYTFDNGKMPLYYDIDLEILEEERIENPVSDTDLLINDINDFKIDLIAQAISKEEIYSDFKYNLYDEYINKKINLETINYILNDKNIDFTLISDLYGVDLSSFDTLDKSSLVLLRDDLNEEVSSLLKVINNNDYSWYLNMQLSILRESEKDSNTLNMIKAYEKLLDLNITDPDDYRISIAEDIINLYNQKVVIMDESDYLKSGMVMDYGEYVRISELKNKQIDDEIEISWYALSNNIDLSLNTKSFLRDSINNNFVFISLVVVILAGGIVSTEFNKGTIRLLLIRPNKRFKILLAKFLAITIVALILGVLSYIISFLINGILFGFSDYFIPDLVATSSGVVEKSFIFRSFCNVFILLIPIIFIGVFAIFLSVLTNSTALSVGISIFLLIGYQLIILLLSSFGVPFMDYTFLPYLDYSQFLDNSYLDNMSMYGIYYSFAKANLVVVMWTVMFYVFSNIIFVKKDIKN